MTALDTLIQSKQPQLVLLRTTTQGTADVQTKQVRPLSVDIPKSVDEQPSLLPGAKTEKQILEIWEQVLSLTIGSMGRSDSFFEFGGDSLLATQMLSRVRADFGVELSLMSLFQNATVAEFAKLLAESSITVPVPMLAVVRTESSTFQLGFAQERLWFYNQLEPDSPQHNMPVAVTVTGELRIDDLRRAFAVIIDRHESLRTIFLDDEGEGRQQVLAKSAFHLVDFDVSDISETALRDRKAKEICQGDATKPFDLRAGPLLRGLVIKLSAQEYILMVNMHHIIGDGWSMGVLIRELTMLMDESFTGEPADLPSLPLQYIDFCQWQRAWLTDSDLLEQQLSYWQQKLAAAPLSLNLAPNDVQESLSNQAGASITFLFDSTLLGRMKSLADGQGATLFMLLVAGWKVLLYRYSGQGDLCFATLIAGRYHAETENLIGMFVNTLALRDRVDGNTPFAALLEAVKTTCLDAYRHQDVPYDKVVERLRREGNGVANPASQVMMVLQNTNTGQAGRRFPRYSFDSDTIEFNLNLEFTEVVAGLQLVAQYNTKLYRKETITRFADDFANLMCEVVQAPGRAIDALGCIARGEVFASALADPAVTEEWIVGSSTSPHAEQIWRASTRDDAESVNSLGRQGCIEPSLLQDVILRNFVLDEGYERSTF